MSSKTTRSEYYAKWYQANRDKHLANLKEKVTCDCGSVMNRNCLIRHLKTPKHQKWLAGHKCDCVKCSCNKV